MRHRGRGSHSEHHRSNRGGWLRASVLGANDGIVSTASLVLGVAAAHGSSAAVVTAGLAGLVGGSLSMAAGEYGSVSSQRDVEEADLAREREELRTMPDRELAELTGVLFFDSSSLRKTIPGSRVLEDVFSCFDQSRSFGWASNGDPKVVHQWR